MGAVASLGNWFCWVFGGVKVDSQSEKGSMFCRFTYTFTIKIKDQSKCRYIILNMSHVSYVYGLV